MFENHFQIDHNRSHFLNKKPQKAYFEFKRQKISKYALSVWIFAPKIPIIRHQLGLMDFLDDVSMLNAKEKLRWLNSLPG